MVKGRFGFEDGDVKEFYERLLTREKNKSLNGVGTFHSCITTTEQLFMNAHGNNDKRDSRVFKTLEIDS